RRSWSPDSSTRDDLAGALDVGGDGRHQLVGRLVALLVPDPLPEYDRERLAGELVPLVVQQERLDVERLDTEGGVRAHVDRRDVLALSVLRDAGVDALTRQQQPGPRLQVRRRVPGAA